MSQYSGTSATSFNFSIISIDCFSNSCFLASRKRRYGSVRPGCTELYSSQSRRRELYRAARLLSLRGAANGGVSSCSGTLAPRLPSFARISRVIAAAIVPGGAGSSVTRSDCDFR